ncbi:hypothetical protein PoB_004169500 [Plakobranchus ocellatus]|uniref:Apple domain-containing protein n=1 Tax=Plakobranchus ocellatus TaxID=259542 RepID=A0AAV4B3I3_9GAST|nr:hypothetical protein PoB_004169500 [Plakobranchus ocellatus]
MANSSRSKRLRSQSLVVLIWLFYQLIFGPSITVCTSELSNFVKLRNRIFICESDSLLLKSSSSTYLECARKCKGQADCTVFTFTPYTARRQSTGLNLGTCAWCPANNIVNVSHTATGPQFKTWYNVLDNVVQWQNFTKLEIPGALSVGRYLIAYGRIPDPAPDLTRVTIFSSY